MFIDPMTLFILGEILVVYIIINVFLFYKSRLYKVLLALLKEMRFEKLRREQLKQQELAELRAKNKDLFKKNAVMEETVKSAGKSIPEQLEERIAVLQKENPHAKDLVNAVERDSSAQWLRLRMLELEKELLSGAISEERWQELANEAISRLHKQQDLEATNQANQKTDAESSRYTGQLETDLEETQRRLTDALLRVNHLEGELDDIRTINVPEARTVEAPIRGKHDDEIYRLKCDNFDLHEAINKLKLELQQANPSALEDPYTNLLEAQVANMEQYIKSADIATGLMEQEIEAYKNDLQELQDRVSNTAVMHTAMDIAPLKKLNEQAELQNDALLSIKQTAQRIRDGEDSELVLAEQDAHIARLERIIKESEQCISILENELKNSSSSLEEIERARKAKKAEDAAAKLNSLSTSQKGQKEGVSNIRNLIEEIRAGGDADELLNQQETEIDRLSQFLKESDTLISQLESELDVLQQKLDEQERSISAEKSTRPETNENIEEMEGLLQQFISDMQSLLKEITKLEDENISLKDQITVLADEQEALRKTSTGASAAAIAGSTDAPDTTVPTAVEPAEELHGSAEADAEEELQVNAETDPETDLVDSEEPEPLVELDDIEEPLKQPPLSETVTLNETPTEPAWESESEAEAEAEINTGTGTEEPETNAESEPESAPSVEVTSDLESEGEPPALPADAELEEDQESVPTDTGFNATVVDLDDFDLGDVGDLDLSLADFGIDENQTETAQVAAPTDLSAASSEIPESTPDSELGGDSSDDFTGTTIDFDDFDIGADFEDDIDTASIDEEIANLQRQIDEQTGETIPLQEKED